MHGRKTYSRIGERDELNRQGEESIRFGLPLEAGSQEELWRPWCDSNAQPSD